MARSTDTDVIEASEGQPSDLPRPKRRGVWAAGMLSIGIVAGHALVPMEHAWVSIALIALAVVGAGLVVALARRSSAGALAMPLLAGVLLLVGAGWEVARTKTARVDRLDRIVTIAGQPADDAPVTIEVTITSPGVVRAMNTGMLEPPRWQRPSRVGRGSVSRVLIGDVWQDASGSVSLVWPAAMPSFRAGDHLRVTGEFTAVAGPANPGQIDARPAANQDGRAGTVIIDGPDAVEEVGGASGVFAWAAGATRVVVGQARQWALSGLDAAFPVEGAAHARARAMMRAMLLGEQESELPQASQDLARLGLVHVLSISGFHLAVLALVVLWLLRAMSISPRRQALIALAVTIAYVVLVPAEAPVLRSAMMVGVLLVAEATGRRYDRLNVLGWTACVLLLWRPHDLFTPGFQLSFLSTGVLLWKGSQLTDAMVAWRPFALPGVRGRSASAARTLAGQGDSLSDWLIRGVAGSVAIGMLAVVATAPLVLWHTGMFPGWGVLLGIALTPLASIALVAGFAAVVVGVAWAGAGSVVGVIAESPCRVIFAVADLAEHAPGASQWLGTSGSTLMLLWAIAATTVVLAFMKSPRSRVIGPVAVLFLAVPMAAQLIPMKSSASEGWALAISGSSCSVIRTSSGQCIVIDPGSGSQRGEMIIRRAAWKIAGRGDVVVVITSPQVERFSHLPELLGPLGVSRVLVPEDLVTLAEQRPLGPQGKVLAAIEQAGVAVEAFDPRQTLQLAGQRFTIPKRGPVQWGQHELAPLSKREARWITP